MATPSNSSYGSTCLSIIEQGHLGISATEQDGSHTTTVFHLIKWSGPARETDCEGCTDGTNTAPIWGQDYSVVTGLSTTGRLARRVQIDAVDKNARNVFQQRTEFSDNQTTPANPLQARPIITWDIADKGTEPYFRDNNLTGFNPSGGAVTAPAGPCPTLNSAGERFQEFLQRKTGAVSATYSVNVPLTGSVTGYGGSTVSAFNAATAVLYCAGGTNASNPAINSDAFTFDGFPIAIGQALASACKCSGVQVENGVNFRTVAWTLLFKSSWLDIVEDRGFNALMASYEGGLEALGPISNGTTSQQTQTPWPLNGLGHARPNITDAPALLTFWPYRAIPFTPLGFT